MNTIKYNWSLLQYITAYIKNQVTNSPRTFLLSMTDLNNKTAELSPLTPLLLTPEEHSFISSTVPNSLEEKLPVILNDSKKLYEGYINRQSNNNIFVYDKFFLELVACIDTLRQNKPNFSIYGLPSIEIIKKIYKGILIIPDTATISDLESIKLSRLDATTGKIIGPPYFTTGNISFTDHAIKKYGF
ncbi:MAG: hypothetical protein QXG00_03365 [Candidatus Woesearchaeota archaeon]